MSEETRQRAGVEALPIRVDRRTLLRAGVGLGAAPLLTGCVVPGHGEEPGMVPAATVAPFAGNGGEVPLLVDTAWLAARLGDRALRLIDLSALATYRRGHLPGAHHAYWQDANDRFDDVYGVIADDQGDPGARERLLRGWGVDDESTIVAYDDDRGRRAARAIWLLRYLGHPRATMLDGGVAAWRGKGGDVEREERAVPRVAAATVDPQSGYVIGTRELIDRLDDPGLVILDARTAAEAADDVNGQVPVGQIPGSISVPWTATLRDDVGRLKRPGELADLYQRAGIEPRPETRVAVYARFGTEAGHSWLVLKLLGLESVRIYDRGWAGWAADPARPRQPVD